MWGDFCIIIVYAYGGVNRLTSFFFYATLQEKGGIFLAIEQKIEALVDSILLDYQKEEILTVLTTPSTRIKK